MYVHVDGCVECSDACRGVLFSTQWFFRRLCSFNCVPSLRVDVPYCHTLALGDVSAFLTRLAVRQIWIDLVNQLASSSTFCGGSNS